MSVNGEEVQDKRQFAALAASFKEGGTLAIAHRGRPHECWHPSEPLKHAQMCSLTPLGWVGSIDSVRSASDRVSLGVYNEKRSEKRKVEVTVLPHRVEALSGEEVLSPSAQCTSRALRLCLGRACAARACLGRACAYACMPRWAQAKAALVQIGIELDDAPTDYMLGNVMWHVKIADGLAEKAGITSDDYVLQVMGQYVTGQDDFEQKISSRVHGAKVELLLVSDNSGKKRTVKIDLPLHGTQVPCASGKREPACEMCTCTCVWLSVRACA